MLIRKLGASAWRTPLVASYEDEAALEDLLERSPELLPTSGQGEPMVVVRQLGSLAGPIDLTVINQFGDITLVECKLRANPEIRRKIVGQLFAYAASLWELSYDQLDRAYRLRKGRGLADAMADAVVAAGGEWDEAAFRERLTANLRSGAARLVFAVDEITEELRRTVMYINAHTTGELQVVALELQYLADEGVELLVPKVFGKETAERKAAEGQAEAGLRVIWTANDVLAALRNSVRPEALEAIERLVTWTVGQGGSGQGSGAQPSFNAWLAVAGQWVSTWSCYAQTRTLSINFGTLIRKVPRERLDVLAQDLRAIPGVAPYLEGLEESGYRRYPSLPLDEVFGRTGTIDGVERALERLMGVEPEG